MKKILILILMMISLMSVDAQVTISPVDFNSNNDDFAPTLTENGRKIFYTSAKSGNYQKVYTVEKVGDTYRNITQLPGDVNKASEVGVCAITPDGQYIIFSAYEHNEKSIGRTDLYSARKVKGEWVDIQNLGPNINSEYWDAQPTLSSDGRTLFFVSDRPGGSGGTDIYYSELGNDGWKKANPLTTINTSSDEMSPVISQDNKTFTFASNKPGGRGNFDIYFAKYQNGSFANVRNAEDPINTTADELFYVPLQNTDQAYFSTNFNRPDGDLDIYLAVPNPHPSDAVVFVSGKVFDAMTNEPLKAKIEITETKTGKKVANFYSDDETGNYYVVLQPGKNYLITAKSDDYMFLSEKFEVPANAKGSEIIKDLPLSKDNTFLRVFFEYNKSDLQDESYPDLGNAIEYLKSNQNIKVVIEGHTDDLGTDSYNDKLSLDRANSVKTYMVKEGIESGRIKTIGYGEKKPLIKEQTDEARATNRRVEMKIQK